MINTAINNKYKICLIDDDETYLYGVKKLIEFKRLCNEILVFKNAQEAMEYFFSHLHTPERLPEIILLDLNMPVMNGWQFLQALSSNNPEIFNYISVYMVSSSISSSDIQRAKSHANLSGYFVKPVSLANLEQIFSLIN